jgi:hypothetical protein
MMNFQAATEPSTTGGTTSFFGGFSWFHQFDPPYSCKSGEDRSDLIVQNSSYAKEILSLNNDVPTDIDWN